MNPPKTNLPTGPPPRGARVAAGGGVAGVFVALSLFGGLQSWMPANFITSYVPFPSAVADFQETFTGRHWPGLEVDTFRSAFQVLLLLAWGSYALTFAAGLGFRAALSLRVLVPTATVLAVGLALLCPSSLSGDPYHYAGEGRLVALYGGNPYGESLLALEHAHDPTPPYVWRSIPTVYGPVWILVETLLECVTAALPIYFQVAGFKLLAAAALLGMAFAGRAVAEHFETGTGNLSFQLIAFNPLFLIEGPAIGHNDLFMMSLVALAAWASIRNRWLAASLLLGLAAGVKYLPAVAVPWLILDRWRGRALLAHWRTALGMAVLGAAPLVLAYLPFARGSELASGLRQHFQRERTEELDARIAWLEAHGVPKALAPGLPALGRQLAAVATYLGLTAWLVWPRAITAGNWLLAWPILALGLFVFTLGIWYPWYLIWPWSLALMRWDRPALYSSFACFTLAVLVTFRYTVTW